MKLRELVKSDCNVQKTSKPVNEAGASNYEAERMVNTFIDTLSVKWDVPAQHVVNFIKAFLKKHYK